LLQTHEHSQVWPGALKLADYIRLNRLERFREGNILELGAATGALAIYLSSHPQCLSVYTSDIDDGGDVESNILHNFQLNGLSHKGHLPYTWGESWQEAANKLQDIQVNFSPINFRFIIASDILLYVSAYPALVRTLENLFDGGTIVEFLMSWNRRIDESAIFFRLMETSNFQCVKVESGIYSFTRSACII